MCRSIHQLHNFEPPATTDEVQAAALQYVRKIAGTTKPAKSNQAAFDHAVAEIAHITQHLLDDLVTSAPPRNRDVATGGAIARLATAVRGGELTAITSSSTDPFDLRRFVTAQDDGSYAAAVRELRRGRKTSHWMWYVFPQLAGLGYSPMAQRYAIGSLDEARAYLAHPVLGGRLREVTQIVAGPRRHRSGCSA